MKIGFSQVEITPPHGVFLCGQLEPVQAQGVESPLYATAMCLDDGKTQSLICGCDLVAIPNNLARDVTQAAKTITGIPDTHMTLGATHTHSGPNTIDLFGKDAHGNYLQGLREKLVQAMRQAQENCQPARLTVSHGRVENVAFNRRFVMSDGTIQTHPLRMDPHIVEPEGPDSHHVDIFGAQADTGDILGVLVVFGCHATVMARDNPLISADYPGKFRDAIRHRYGKDLPVIFLQGGGGNICQVNPRQDAESQVGPEWARRMGEAIGSAAMDQIESSADVARGSLRVMTRTLEIPRRTIRPELVRWAQTAKAAVEPTPILSHYGNERYGQVFPPVVSLEDLFQTPFWAGFYANEILTLERHRAESPVVRFTLQVTAMNNWALVALPCELFVEWADAIRHESPFLHTAVVSLANGWNGYVPTRKAFTQPGGYETKELSSSLLDPGAGDVIHQNVLSMLRELKSQ